MVSKETITSNWKSLVGAVKQKFGELTNDDLTRVEGNLDQLIALVQRNSGATKDQISEFVRSFLASASDSYETTSEKALQWAGVASDAVRDGVDRMTTEAQRGVQYSKTAVRKKPLESVAIAVSAGFLAGIAIGISMARKRS
jgi:uncharacterized protein YjbJ (UPF0337 family)